MGRYNFPRRKCIRLRDYDYSRAGAYFITICAEGTLCIFGRVENADMNLAPIGNLCADQCLQIPNHFAGVELDCFVVMPNHMHAIIVLPDLTAFPHHRIIRRGAVPSPANIVDTLPSGAAVGPAEVGIPSPANIVDTLPSGAAVGPASVEIQSPANDADSLRRGAIPSPDDNPEFRYRKGAVLLPRIAHPRQHLGRIVAWHKYLSTKSVTELNQGELTRFWQRGYHDHIIRDEADLRRIREYIENNPLKWELDRYYRAQ